MSAVGGWIHVLSFLAPHQGSTFNTLYGAWRVEPRCVALLQLALVCKAFLHGAGIFKRAFVFHRMLLEHQMYAPRGADPFSFDRFRAAHVRFPALDDVTLDLDAGVPMHEDDDSTDSRPLHPPGGLDLLLEELAGFTSITRLLLEGNDLETFPEELCSLVNLKELNVKFNDISVLPDEFGDLTALKKLNLTCNALDEDTVPDSIRALTRLTELHLDRNQFNQLPDAVQALTALKTLGLNSNALTTLPVWFDTLTNLKTLGLDSNRFTTFPTSIRALTGYSTYLTTSLTYFPYLLTYLLTYL